VRWPRLYQSSAVARGSSKSERESCAGDFESGNAAQYVALAGSPLRAGTEEARKAPSPSARILA